MRVLMHKVLNLMVCDPARDHGKRERRAAEHTARKSGRNQLMRDLAREVAGAPDEVSCLST